MLSRALHHPAFSSVSRRDLSRSTVKKTKSVHFFTTCPESWGGSEELWARTARKMAGEDYWVTATLAHLDRNHPEVIKLIEAGVRLENYRGIPLLRRYGGFHWRWETPLTVARLRHMNPELAVISQGENMDGHRQIGFCQQAGIPYVLICQKALEDECPVDGSRPYLKDFFNSARRVFFVSEHNRTLTEQVLGLHLINSEVVRNPFKVDYDVELPWPKAEPGKFRLACVARLWMKDKGQDLLLRVLSREKWKNRDLEVHFYGNGLNAIALTEMAQILKVEKVKFCGFVEDVTEIWRNYHGLILPSRHEGLPLALVEAMLCGRPSITTRAGGNAEALDDGISGFLAAASTVDAIDEAMERAWNRRHEWPEIGATAAAQIRKKVPRDPTELFAAKIAAIHSEVAPSRWP
jgi:glycosyltransferase involved in cell wall biosynthesis